MKKIITHIGIKKKTTGNIVYLCNQAYLANSEKLGKPHTVLQCKNCIRMVHKCDNRISTLEKEHNGKVIIGVLKNSN